MSELSQILTKTNIVISLGRYELAIKLAQKALGISPNNPFAYYYLSCANAFLKNFDEAEKLVKLALSYEPISENCLLLYCIIMLATKQYTKAIEKADEMLKINPQNANAMYYKGSSYEKIKKYKEAGFWIKQALQINPNDSSFHLKLADIYSDTNQKEFAKREYLEALKFDPNNSSSLNNYGMHLLKYNWYSKNGLQLLKSSLQNTPNDKNVIDNYETFLFIQKIPKACLKAFFSFKNFLIICILVLLYYFYPKDFIGIIISTIFCLILYIIVLIPVSLIFAKNNKIAK